MILTETRMEYLAECLEGFPRWPLVPAPTPCHRLNRLSEEFGVEVYCKRDDLTGFGLGGNKARKLELLIREAVEHKSDTLVTAGGVQSNFCRMTAAAGAAADMEVHLVLGGGEEPPRFTGNLILDRILGAHIHYVASPDWAVWEEESKRLESELAASGRKAFRIPIGGSVPTGVVGYVRAFMEILQDQTRLGVAFDRIIHASGSGGTQSGLVTGKEMTGWAGVVQGVSVVPDSDSLAATVYRLAAIASGMLGGRVDRESVLVDGSFSGSAYGVHTPEGEAAIRTFARREGIFLDHVYTGKAAAAMLHGLAQGAFSGETVLFLHTGGQPELFA